MHVFAHGCVSWRSAPEVIIQEVCPPQVFGTESLPGLESSTSLDCWLASFRETVLTALTPRVFLWVLGMVSGLYTLY